jgi:hypothetical protein
MLVDDDVVVFLCTFAHALLFFLCSFFVHGIADDFHALLPRLGLFVEEVAGSTEMYTSVPYDYDDLLVILRKKNTPLLIQTAMEDRDATYSDVQQCIEGVVKNEQYPALNHTTTPTYTNMGVGEIALFMGWLSSL